MARLTNHELMEFEKFGYLPALHPPTTLPPTPHMQPDSIEIKNTRYADLRAHYAPARTADHTCAVIVELLDDIEKLTTSRNYGRDIINDMTLEAELADAHTKEVEQQLVALMAAVSKLRRMAVNNASGSVSLFAIERELAGISIKEAKDVLKECPECNGRGSNQHVYGFAGADRVECEKCKGSGDLPSVGKEVAHG